MHTRDDTEAVDVRAITARVKKAVREKYPKIRRVFFDVTEDPG
jgi:hypothetical protein